MSPTPKLVDHYFAVVYADKPEERFITLAAAMQYVLDYPYTPGVVVYHRFENTEGQPVMRMLDDNRWEPLGSDRDTATNESGL